jgi:hypothetical protein
MVGNIGVWISAPEGYLVVGSGRTEAGRCEGIHLGITPDEPRDRGVDALGRLC